jgi:hypothetical protein
MSSCREVAMFNPDIPLQMLYAQCDAASCAHDGDAWEAYAAVLDRLAANRRIAEAAGWTSCAIERDGDAGRFQLFGIPPSETLRTMVPDWPHADTERGQS